MSLERRKMLVELANRYDVMVLEDSPYREIRFEGETLPCIKTFDTENRVIHLGSFSKILSPGMRLGWVVAEPEIAAKLALLKMAADTQNSTLNMYIADTYLEMFDINEHIEGLKQIYRQKRDLMLTTIQAEFPPEINHTHSEGGLFTWLTFPAQIDAARLMADRVLPEAKVAYVPGAPFYARNPEANHCRINYSCVTPEKIVHGITKLGKILYDELK
jgi:2-aminoadipate transaminase